MKQVKTIAVVYGGNSSEVDISILSGRYAAANIDRDKYKVLEVLLRGSDWKVVEWHDEKMNVLADIDKNDFSFMAGGEKKKIDAAFIMIHGTPGENGLLQGYFEMIGIPFTTCSAFVSTIAFNKYSCKTFLRDLGVKMAREVFLRKGDRYNARDIVERLGLPLFIKPSDGGSSFGISKVKKAEDLDKAIYEAFQESDTILVEEFIPGREMTQGVYFSKGEVIALPITEIIPDNEYFDYESKYLGKSKEICPANISSELAAVVSGQSARIYHYFGCRGLIRIDYIVNGDDVYFLEINTAPGMTKMSLVPQQVKVAGMDIKSFFTALIEEVA